METYHIHINGIVQGVGFRPFVYTIAKKLRINGTVRNDNDGVNISFNSSSSEKAHYFFNLLQSEAPVKARILSSSMKRVKKQHFEDFSIDVSKKNNTSVQTLVAPDYVLCEDCKQELHNPNNRRYRYPFITCTQCGPRFSIINTLPYERHNTSMYSSQMCPSCNAEYNDITNRRYFSQTNSCKKCGIKITLWINPKEPFQSNDTETILSYCQKILRKGKIIAVKGTSGYLLLCDAHQEKTIQRLRQKKQRPKKPFAVLYPDMNSVQRDFLISAQEITHLQHPSAPIILLKPKKETENKVALQAIAPGLNTIGVMLPSNPLLELLAKDFTKPLIATSANISGAPTIHKDAEALLHLFEIAAYILTHHREIIIPQDDSVLRLLPDSSQMVFMRRARGYAPIYHNNVKVNEKCILTLGALMKSTFTLGINTHIFVSQYLGSGGNYEYQETYKNTLEHFKKLYFAHPDIIVADLHQDYFTHQLAKEIALDSKADFFAVQHHKAHFTAVLAENNLLENTTDKIMGIIWDGTGLGTDGNIWGGEFFYFEKKHIRRLTHLEYTANIAGDKTAREPRLSALSFCQKQEDIPDFIKEKFTEKEFEVYSKMLFSTSIQTSSMGRFFDAVASILGLCDYSTYEGEAAMYLQIVAEKYFDENGYSLSSHYDMPPIIDGQLVITKWIKNIISEYLNGINIGWIAAKFHYSLVMLIKQIALKYQIKNLCFSGGVFQNTLLLFLVKYHLQEEFQLHFHKQLSPNDENISLGQFFYIHHNIDNEK